MWPKREEEEMGAANWFWGQVHDVTGGNERLRYLGKEQHELMTQDGSDESDHEEGANSR